MWKLRNVLRKPDDEGATGGGGVAAAPAPAAAPAAAPAPAASAPAGAPAASPAAAPTPAAAPAAAPAPAADKGNEGYWPADWRETVSKADEKRLTALGRYASPEAAMQALFAAQDRIRSGELKPVLGKNASADELKDWRAAHGIPETADKYDLGKDVKIDEGDAPMMAEILKAAHGTNQTPAQVAATVKTWNTIKAQAFEQRAVKDKEIQTASEDALRTEWGPDYRLNINLIHGMLDGASDQVLKDQLLQSRLPDGTPFGSSPEVMKWLVGLSRIQNPTGVVVPGGEGNQMQDVETEIDKIEKTMRENRTAYNKDEKMQARYRELLGAREKLKPRGA